MADPLPPTLSVAPSTIVARLAAGDLTDASPASIRTLLNVADNADNTLDFLNGAALPAVTVAPGDLVLIQDIDDSNNLATVTVQSIVDLAQGVGSNLLINGNFNIAQRGTSFAAVVTGQYLLDRWLWGQVGAGVVTVTQDTDVPDGFSEFSFGVDVTTADASIVAGDFYELNQRIEGFNTIPMAMGGADAAGLVLSFWVRSTVTGVHCVSFRNNGNARSYVAEYTVSVSDTWEFKTITLTGDLTGTWLKDNGIGCSVGFTLAAGATFQTAADTWAAGNFMATANQVNAMSNAANFFKVSQVKLEVGNQATTLTPRSFGDELGLCKRYYQKTFPYSVAPAQNAGNENVLQYIAFRAGANANIITWNFPVQMRIEPHTEVFYNPNAANALWRNSAGGDSAAGSSIASQSSDSRLQVLNAQVGGDLVGDQMFIHSTVDAEL